MKIIEQVKYESTIDNVIVVEDVNDIKPDDRLFYEVSYFKPISVSYKTIKTRSGGHIQVIDKEEFESIRTGMFKEITDKEYFLVNDNRLKEPEYLKHHNFVIKRNT